MAPLCCVLLILFGASLMCVFGVLWCLVVHSWCFSTPPCYEFLVLFIACLLCTFNDLQCFLVAYWWCFSMLPCVFLVSSPPSWFGTFLTSWCSFPPPCSAFLMLFGSFSDWYAPPPPLFLAIVEEIFFVVSFSITNLRYFFSSH